MKITCKTEKNLLYNEILMKMYQTVVVKNLEELKSSN